MAVGVPDVTRRALMGKYAFEDLAEALDDHYVQDLQGAEDAAARERVRATFNAASVDRRRAQRIAAMSFIPFVGLLVWHAFNHSVPLFISSMAAFVVAFTAIGRIGPMRRLALREAVHEYSEYLFLLPLFLSITLLQKTGFFNQVTVLIHQGVEVLGVSHVAFLQFAGAAFLSAILDNNVVADFAGRALHDLSVGLIYLFSLAQIAGYAVGGCSTTHWLSAVGGSVLLHPASTGRALHPISVDQGDDAGRAGDLRAHDSYRGGESFILRFAG